jgi:sterol desaturase/sphingolipid hydroxylase (fatty acid hydroxylase superfamily)
MPPRRPLVFALAGLAVAAAGVTLLRAEDRRPLRRAAEPRPRRQLTNLALGAGSLAAAAAMQRMAVQPLLDSGRWRGGIAARLPLPRPMRDIAAFLALDYAMFLWHIATHRVGLLWRLHRVHHVDLDLDVTTALRFHFADQLVSVPARVAMVLLVGPRPRIHAAWNAFFFLSILFHHANVRLPRRLEHALAHVLTTPRMHGIHHMARRDATDSNWTSGFSFWDRLHGTFRLDLERGALPIGVPAYPVPVRTLEALALPLRSASGDWSAAR